MSAVAKDIGYDIVKKPIVIAGTVIVIGGIAYYFLSDTLLGDMFGLLYDGLYYTMYGLTEAVNFLADGDTWKSAGNFFTGDVGGFFKDDIGGGFKDAGDSIKNAFKF
jgi:hypothetical protein